MARVNRMSAASGAAVLGLVLAVAPAQAQALEMTNPAGMSTPRTYTHGVRAGKLLFCAGQVGFDEQGSWLVPACGNRSSIPFAT